MSKADFCKSNVIDLTLKTPALNQYIDRKRLCQSVLSASSYPKRACVSVERVTIDLSDDAIDVDADAVNRANIADTKVCAEMPTLDDSNHTPLGFSITSRKKPLISTSLVEEKTVGIAIVKTGPKSTLAWSPTDSLKGASQHFPPLESAPSGHNIDPNVFWRNLCGTHSSVQLPTKNVVIPMNSHFINVIEPAVSQMRALDGYESRREFIEYLILLLCDINPYLATHYIFGIAKCTTIRLGISLEGFTHKNDHADTSECPSWRAGHSISEALPYTNCNLRNGGMNLSWVNARSICKNDGCGHCDVWTIVEAYQAAQLLVIFCYVCAQLDIPVF
jgi:hypothetical protein